PDVVHHVAVAEHRALCQPGGAAGVLQEGDVREAEFDWQERLAFAAFQRGRESDGAFEVKRRYLLPDVLQYEVHEPAFRLVQQVADLGSYHMPYRRVGYDPFQDVREVLQDD